MSNASVSKTKPARHKKYLLVRYGQMKNIGLFEHNQAEIPKLATRVVVKTEKGLELGYLVGQLTAYKSGQFRFSPEQLKEYFERSGIDCPTEPAGQFVRFATDDDINEERHLRQIVKQEIETCKKFIKELNLPMKIVDAEHILGGERIIFYFKADGRIDFRELVKKLAREYQTRIEMRQIGSRDEARILGDIEACGQECCCQRFLKVLKPVNMKMAKMQKATLDPSKISGYCGRLKCCLRYEDQTYTELKERLPRKNARVRTPRGIGRVIDTQILTQLVMVEYEDGEREALDVEQIEVIAQPTKQAEQTQEPEELDEELDEQLAETEEDEDYQDKDNEDETEDVNNDETD